VWPLLARAFADRGRYLAAFGAVLEARAAGVTDKTMMPLLQRIEQRLGSRLDPWRKLMGPGVAAE
jgi:hypothetical protein